MGPTRLRAVTHLEIGADDVNTALAVAREELGGAVGRAA